MAYGNRLCWCLLFASLLLCNSRNTLTFSVEEEEEAAAGANGRRLTAVSMDDYSEPSANRAHEPGNIIGCGGGKNRENSSPP